MKREPPFAFAPDSRVVFATLWGGSEIGWFTNRIGTGSPLPPGDYVITLRLDEVRTLSRVYSNVEISAPIVITPTVLTSNVITPTPMKP